MNLHRDDLLTLEYAVAQDLLMVEVRSGILTADDIRKVFAAVVGQVRKRSIPFVLVDFSHNQIEINEYAYQALMTKLAVSLMPTCIRKIARVASTDVTREEKVDRTYNQIQQAVRLKLEFRNFHSRLQALQWLQASDEK